MANKPQNTVAALREMVPCVGSMIASCPEWFRDMYEKEGVKAWSTLLSSTADEMEQMQKLNGKLYKTLYPD